VTGQIANAVSIASAPKKPPDPTTFGSYEKRPASPAAFPFWRPAHLPSLETFQFGNQFGEAGFRTRGPRVSYRGPEIMGKKAVEGSASRSIFSGRRFSSVVIQA
jgi:hypothetical protein